MRVGLCAARAACAVDVHMCFNPSLLLLSWIFLPVNEIRWRSMNASLCEPVEACMDGANHLSLISPSLFCLGIAFTLLHHAFLPLRFSSSRSAYHRPPLPSRKRPLCPQDAIPVPLSNFPRPAADPSLRVPARRGRRGRDHPTSLPAGGGTPATLLQVVPGPEHRRGVGGQLQ